MSIFPRFFRARVVTLLAVPALGCLSGCAFAARRGDARVIRPKDNFLTMLVSVGMIREGYRVTLPAIPLDRAGTTRFKVGPLPPGTYTYNVYLTGGSLYGNDYAHDFTHDPHKTPPSASHWNTVISIEATAPDGNRLFHREARLRDLGWHRYDSQMSPKVDLPDVISLDYQLTITVRSPSTMAGEKMHITAFGEPP